MWLLKQLNVSRLYKFVIAAGIPVKENVQNYNASHYFDEF
jgi:hypothetical protein